MRKLTIEHLAPYFPYGLNWFCLDQDSREIENLPLVKIDLANEVLEIGGMDIDFDEIPYSNGLTIQPILRPLSDLHGFKENVLSEHDINIILEDKFGLEYGVFSHYKGEINIELDGDPLLRHDENKTIAFTAVLEANKLLLKNHFDVFGLIPLGLAIDINTIKP